MPRNSKINPTHLTAQEFNTLYTDAIKSYADATWLLADLLAIGKEKFGRTNLLTMINLPLTKLQWLVGIASLGTRNLNLLPEIHSELIGTENPKKWLTLAEKEKIGPLELRKRIRKAAGIKSKKSAVKVANYPKHIDSIKRELNRLPPEQRLKAKEYIATQLE